MKFNLVMWLISITGYFIILFNFTRPWIYMALIAWFMLHPNYVTLEEPNDRQE